MLLNIHSTVHKTTLRNKEQPSQNANGGEVEKPCFKEMYKQDYCYDFDENTSHF